MGKQVAPTANLLQQGVELHQANRLSEAEAIYRQILASDPEHADANHLLGLIAQHYGNHTLAFSLIAKAIARKPRTAIFHNSLGMALRGAGHLDEAVAAYHSAIELAPDYSKAHNNLGVALAQQGLLDEALASYRRALDLEPGYAEACANLASVYGQLGRIGEADTYYRRAHELAPDSALLYSNVILAQDYDARIDLISQQAERKRWNEKFILPLAPLICPHGNSRNPDRRLRIGYVSADFNYHSACQGFASLILNHDRSNFDVYCYDQNLTSDAMTETLRAAATVWRVSRGLPDNDLAHLIRQDAIDILVDLSGHSGGNRLLVFGRKPAPIQMTGIGSIAPGVTTIDYRWTSQVLTPAEEATLYPEAPVYLHSFFGFTPLANAPAVAPLRRDASGGIVFGSMNRLIKLSDATLALWARILRAVPDSRLLMKFSGIDSPETRSRITAFFAEHGVSEECLILLGRTSQYDHLDAYNRIDIAFDPFPTTGGMTTLESLWMGVPVVGLYNHRKVVNRMIAACCRPAGLDDWIAETEDRYLDIAVEWAHRPKELAALKAGLRHRVREAFFRFREDMEHAYRIAWQRWCAGSPPAPIELSND